MLNVKVLQWFRKTSFYFWLLYTAFPFRWKWYFGWQVAQLKPPLWLSDCLRAHLLYRTCPVEGTGAKASSWSVQAEPVSWVHGLKDAAPGIKVLLSLTPVTKDFQLTQEQQLSCPGTSEVKYSLLATMGNRGRYTQRNFKKPRSNLIKTTFSIAGTISLGNHCYLISLWSRIPQDTWKVLHLRWMCICLCLDTHTTPEVS